MLYKRNLSASEAFMKKTKKRNIQKTNASALLFGLIASTVAFFFSILICAIVANLFENPTAALGALSFFALVFAGAISGFFTSKYKGDGGVAPAALSALVFALILLIVGLVMTEGHLPLVTVINLLLYAVSATTFAILGKKREKKHKHR